MAYCMPGKIYEYLRSGTPILAVVEKPSEVAAFIEEHDRGAAFAIGDSAGIAGFLERAYTDWCEKNWVSELPFSDAVRKFDSVSLTRSLAEALENVTAQRNASCAMASNA